MSVGIQLTKSDVDGMFGGIARDMNVMMVRLKESTAWLAAQTDAQLIAMGYIQGEVNTLRSAIQDATTGLDRLRQVYEGSTTISVALNFKTGFAKQLAGFGL